MVVRSQFSRGCYKRRMVAGFITQRPSRPPFLSSIRSGTLYAPILLSKNSARKSSRESARFRLTAHSNGRTIWIVDAHGDDGKRFVVHGGCRPHQRWLSSISLDRRRHRPFLGFSAIVVLLANCATSPAALTKIRQGRICFCSPHGDDKVIMESENDPSHNVCD